MNEHMPLLYADWLKRVAEDNGKGIDARALGRAGEQIADLLRINANLVIALERYRALMVSDFDGSALAECDAMARAALKEATRA